MPSLPSLGDSSRQPAEVGQTRRGYPADTLEELRFFGFRGGLSRYGDELQARIAFDYELVRECQALVDFILECPDRESRARSYLEALPHLARWAPNLKPGQVIESPQLAPRIPTVCLITPWFPARWLAGSKKDRTKIVQQLARAYAPVRPLALYPCPLTSELERRLRAIGKPLYVVMLDENEPFATTATRLSEARKALGHKPQARSRHHRYDRGPIAALDRLACYRLSNISKEERQRLFGKFDFLRSQNVDSKISKGRKAILEEMRNRNYITLL
jgi:hypothetical protein